MVRARWKPAFVNYFLLKSIAKSKSRVVIRTKSRSSTILQSFIGLFFEVYTGRYYTKIYVEQRMVGHKLGEFAFTRKIGKIHEKRFRVFKKYGAKKSGVIKKK